MAKTVTVKSESELLEAFGGGKLYGYTPAEKMDATKFEYPVTFVLNEKAKTFSLKKEEPAKVTQAPASTNDKKEKLVKNIFIGVCIVVGVAIIAITIGKLFF